MIYARRFYWVDIHPLDITALLDAFVAHPEFLAYPHPPEEARQIGASLLTDVHNLVWATYNDKTLTGVVLLTRVIPKVDALVHFLFLDQNLAGKRKLLNNLLGHVFTDLGFQRLSMEVPDRVVKVRKNRPIAIGTRLERFARKTLGFRLEGEIRDRHTELPDSLTNDWVARQGSRIERGYYDGQTWSDIVRLRLLASEWVGVTGEVTPCQSEPQPEASSPPLPAPQ